MTHSRRSARPAVLLFCMATQAFAHHSAAIYDTGQTVSIEGVVRGMQWANPHVYINMEQTTESGAKVAWAVEALPPAAMRRLGWTEQTLKPGDTLKVSGNPTRRTRNRGIYPATIEVGGVTLFQSATNIQRLASATIEPAVAATSLEGTWETLANVDLYVFFYRSAMQLTEAGQRARDSYDEATMLPARECMPYSSPLLMIDPDFKQITIGTDTITINGGFAPAERTIHLNLSSHDGAAASLQGHSIGHWEGTTLVIDTRHFAEHRIGNGYRGIASGAQKHLVERLTLQDNGTRLSYSFELNDPEYLAGPVTGSAEWAYRPDLEFVREPCDLSNAQEFRND